MLCVMELFAPEIKPDETLMEPRKSRLLIGHEKECSKLLAMVRAGRLPQGIIFSGMRGIGKATAAFAFCRFLLSGAGNEEKMDAPDGHEVFARVASAGESDLLTIEKLQDKHLLGVGVVRKIANFVHHTASKDDGWRVVVVDDADIMTTSAQNALLKILEEPPPKTVLILVAHRIGRLLPTIRSRAGVINFMPLCKGDMAQILSLSPNVPTDDDLEFLHSLSGGSAGSALSYMEGEAIEVWTKVKELLESKNWKDIHSFAENMGRKDAGETYKTFADLIMWNARASCKKEIGNMDLVRVHDELLKHFSNVNNNSLDHKYGVIGVFKIMQGK